MRKIFLLLAILFIGCEFPNQGSLHLKNNSGEKVFYNVELSKEPVMLTKISEFDPENAPFPSLEDGEEITINFGDAFETKPVALVAVYALYTDDSTTLAINVLTLSVIEFYGVWFIEIPELSK